jgi:MoaA/NifB/PqqE/SkfB family radical SAM enzyme
MPRQSLSKRAQNASRVIKFALDRKSVSLSIPAQLAYSPFLVQMIVTRRCNLKCGYCDEFDTESPPVPKALLRQRIAKIRELGTLAIEFSGGEPLLHPDLVDLIRYATKLDFPARMLISNAFLMKEKNIIALNQAGLTHLQVSVDGVRANEVTKKTLDVLKGRLERLAALAEFKVTLSGVIGTCPPEETVQIIEFAQKHRFTPRVLLIHDDHGQLKLTPEELANYHEAQRRLRVIFSESHGYREKLVAGEKAPFKCRAGARYLYVDEHGLAHWCSQQAHRFGKPIIDYSLEDLKHEFYHSKGGCEDLCTIGCARTCSAFDEFRAIEAP